MNRYFSILAAILLTALPLAAQEEGADSLALLRASAATQNYEAMTAYAADVTVVATRRVPCSEFYLWYGHLTEGAWGRDGNWYPDETQVLYLSRTGADGSKDVVWSCPADTAWTTPEPVCPEAVSPGDEVFPMLSPDGKRLYFASDGLFGAGGYDLYEARWDPQKKSWGQVRNMGFPFNSKADDLLFCDTPDGRFSLLASNRDCGRDSVVIYVLRQETPVFHRIDKKEVDTRARLAVTAPDSGYPFVKRNAIAVPDIRFAAPEEEFDDSFRIGKEGGFARNNRLPAGLVYQVQLFVTAAQPTVKQLKGVSPVFKHPQRSGKILCAAGLFRSFSDAETALSAIRRAGFPSAFIIAFDNGKSISLAQAKKKESSVKVITEEVRIVK
jgi:hypothetical protein